MSAMRRKEIPKLKNCAKCKRLFVGGPEDVFCRDCLQKMQDEKQSVIEYVRENPKTQVRDIMEATGASLYLIRRMVREGFFQTEGTVVTYPCERCGRPITNGKFCEECLQRIQHELRKTEQKFANNIRRAQEGARGMRIYSSHLKNKT